MSTLPTAPTDRILRAILSILVAMACFSCLNAMSKTLSATYPVIEIIWARYFFAFLFMLAMFLLGFVMDAFEIIFVVVPIVAPVLLKMPGVDPVWLGVMMALNLQTSYMHPPLGPTLFFLRGVAPPEIKTTDIYIGVIPFVLIQLFALVVLWYVPGLATALPHALYGG